MVARPQRITARIEKRQNPLFLVRRHHEEPQERQDTARDHTQERERAPAQAGGKSQADEQQTERCSRAEVGLE